ncbi:unnamed protein product [Arctia plantaginis]|uniref:Uncharacterized protein n=1 Tax=Arctia plantaginis TaxID=874455 RepID=A0A8S1AY93_ARCPL|nr:unnamed protein product [Arctia plantaginis]
MGFTQHAIPKLFSKAKERGQKENGRDSILSRPKEEALGAIEQRMISDDVTNVSKRTLQGLELEHRSLSP